MRDLVAVLIPVCAALLASAGTLRHGLVWDDVYNVLQNPWISGEGRLSEAFGTHVAGFVPGRQTAYYRPMFHVVLALIHRFSGTDPLGYRAAAVTIYALTCAALYFVLHLLIWPSAGRRPDSWARALTSGPVIAATLFAVHPAHSEVMAWTSALMDLLAALFSLAAIWIALRPSAPPLVRCAGAAVFYLVALLSKEPALAVLPALALVFRARAMTEPGPERRGAGLVMAALSIVTLAYVALRAHALGGVVGDGGGAVRGLWPALVNAPALLWTYVVTLLIPTDVAPLRDVRLATSLLDARVLAGFALALAAVTGALRFRRIPAAIGGVSLFVLALAPALYLPALGEVLFSTRYVYLPSAGAALLLGAWLERGRAGGTRVRTRAAVAVALVAAGAVMTVRANATWRDQVSLWSAVAAQRPGSAAAQEACGAALLMAGRPNAAIGPLRRALQLDPGRKEARVNLAEALLECGRIAEALQEAEAALRRAPEIPETYVVLGSALLAAGDPRGAAASYNEALRRNPGMEAARRGLQEAERQAARSSGQ